MFIDSLITLWHHDWDTVIDLGCGNGHKTVALSRWFRHVYGMDSNSESITIAKQLKNKIKKSQEDFLFLQGSFDDIPLESNTTDVITMINSLHFCTNIPKLVEQMKQILKEDGIVIICEPGINSKYKDNLDTIAIKRKLNNIRKKKLEFLENVSVLYHSESKIGYVLVCKIKKN